MGAYCSRKRPLRVLLQGLDAAGKTSLLYKLKLGEIVTTIPTIGFNVESVSVANIEITCWDVGGRDKIRPLYRHYYPNTDGFVYVIDSNDKERLDDALDEMSRFLLNEDETRDKVVMILANKQDLEGALSVEQIEEKVKEKVSVHGPTIGGRCVFVKGCSVVEGQGIEAAFSSFVEHIHLLRSEKISPGFLSSAYFLKESTRNDKEQVANGFLGTESRFHFLKKILGIPYVKTILYY